MEEDNIFLVDPDDNDNQELLRYFDTKAGSVNKRKRRELMKWNSADLLLVLKDNYCAYRHYLLLRNESKEVIIDLFLLYNINCGLA